MIFEVFFDVETQLLFSDIPGDDPADLLLSVASVYTRHVDDEGNEIQGEMKSFWHPEAGVQPVVHDLVPIFEKADRIIGFNSKKFDSAVLRPFFLHDIEMLPHFDILEQVRAILGFRLPLDALAQSTLGVNKTDKGTNAVYYWANRNPENLEKLRKYCESDVGITRGLYDYGRHHNHLKYIDRWNKRASIPLDFSYPKTTVHESQIGLF